MCIRDSLEIDGDDVAQEGQAAAGQRLAGRGGLQFGTELFDDLVIVRIAEALDHHERVGIGLPQQVLGLVDLVGGVDGDQHLSLIHI